MRQLCARVGAKDIFQSLIKPLHYTPPSTNNAVLKMITRVLSVPIEMTLNEKNRRKEGKIIAGDKEASV